MHIVRYVRRKGSRPGLERAADKCPVSGRKPAAQLSHLLSIRESGHGRTETAAKSQSSNPQSLLHRPDQSRESETPIFKNWRSFRGGILLFNAGCRSRISGTTSLPLAHFPPASPRQPERHQRARPRYLTTSSLQPTPQHSRHSSAIICWKSFPVLTIRSI